MSDEDKQHSRRSQVEPTTSEVHRHHHHHHHLYVVPGCTGLWQATERNNVGFDEMVELDLEYIQDASVMNDLNIILKTVAIIFKPNGSY